MANTTDCPMFLGIIHSIEDWIVPPKKLKMKKSKLGPAHGMTEGEKQHLSKETGPVTKKIPAEDVIKEHIQKVDPTVRASLEGSCRTTVAYPPRSSPMDRRPSGNWTMRLK